MPYDNPSLQVTADQQIKVVQAPIGSPGYGDVLLHVKCTGICGYVFTLNILIVVTLLSLASVFHPRIQLP
jgi:hypothetical protein